MNTSKKEIALMLKRPIRNKGNDFIKRNQQLMRKREIDSLVEMSRQVIMDKYMDLEN
ncbi:MAG: hypothetical protein H8E32_16145 [Nitrospinae bacterium]|nr:hypothetical protein [Nitrospinota bacterium]